MRPMIRLAALIPFVAFLAACSGAGPMGPGQITSSDPYEAVSGDATAMRVPPACKNISGVDVLMLPPMSIKEVRFEARYRYNTPEGRCTAAPLWEASRSGILVHPKDPFRAWIPRSPRHERTVVTATAPNGIEGRLVF